MQRTQEPSLDAPFFPGAQAAAFVRRRNRFVVECALGGETVQAHLPNPGRLWELLLPGRTVHVVGNGGRATRATPYTAVAVEREGSPVLLHTQETNTVVRRLLEARRIPGLADCRIVRPEATFGRHRFDFLLQRADQSHLVLEVKSCTLFSGNTAMFPDAVTERGRRHLSALADLVQPGRAAGVLFVVHTPRVRFFLPDYHTDFAFSETLRRLRDILWIQAVSVHWRPDLSLGREVRPLDIPWAVLDRECRDRGAYLLLSRLPETRRISVGSLGAPSFREGYYVYVGSARNGLEARLRRHLRQRKTPFWHIDHLLAHTDGQTALPFRTSEPVEHALAAALEGVADWTIPRFGASDCACPTHLFGFADPPLGRAAFVELLLSFRIDRLGKAWSA